MNLDSFKRDLLNRVDIVDVINSRVPLKKGGANWMACCPFHSEKTPSFTVSPSKQFYHCFGCGAHGNAIGFLMEYAGLGYIDALRELAESVGMKLPEYERPKRGPAREEGPDLREYMARAARYYRDQLKQAPQAIEYLKGRGLTGQIAARFGIGYAPDDWQNLEAVFGKYDSKDGRALIDCGLVIENDNGRRYDRFRGRVMFPIVDQRGAVIGFGGRVIGQGEPKYLNSPETPLFEKGRELYGLAQARQAIRQANRVIVVEGYMDVVALAQHGVENAVATLGTATSAIHVQKLLRQADEVVFCFDGDEAGRRAAWHALEVSLEALSDRKAVKFLFLPAEHDPDSYVRELGQKAFQRAVVQADPLSAFLLAQLRARGDLRSLEGRSRLIAEAKPLLKRIAAPALQLQLLKTLAEEVGMAPAEVGRLTEIRMPSVSAERRAPAAQPRGGADSRLERELLRCIEMQPELARQVAIEWVDLRTAEGRAVAALIELVQHDGSTEWNSAALIDHFRDTEHSAVLSAVQSENLSRAANADDVAVVFDHTVAKMQARVRRARALELGAKIKSGVATEEEKREFVHLSSRAAAPAGLVSSAGDPT
ncbi:MAG TPA: DNA primase [Burkholderiales bacterium]|nr:DNA primase [Burkholderiales bacterium]